MQKAYANPENVLSSTLYIMLRLKSTICHISHENNFHSAAPVPRLDIPLFRGYNKGNFISDKAQMRTTPVPFPNPIPERAALLQAFANRAASSLIAFWYSYHRRVQGRTPAGQARYSRREGRLPPSAAINSGGTVEQPNLRPLHPVKSFFDGMRGFLFYPAGNPVSKKG